MRWTPGERGNIEDRRGSSGGRGFGGAAPVGIGGFVLLLLLSWATGTNFLSLLDGGGSAVDNTASSAPVQTTPEEEQRVDFVDAVAEDVQQTWERLLSGRYRRAKVVLFREVTDTACGSGESATGPFYCPGDQRVFLDLSFFRDLSQRLGAPGDFAQAYVIAHEYGHHVQNLLGLNQQAGNASGPAGGSVALELQADCFAGVWGAAAAKPGRAERGQVELDPDDADEALRAASAIGDDRLQKMGTGRVQPERFTHGTSAQRVEWFRRGMESGDPKRCDTLAALTR